ncbi:MAG: VTC domain-containing protein [Chloroflexota bacterium]|nr:MAG: VTC domain-containing protein [Chloroflexota bacterium]
MVVQLFNANSNSAPPLWRIERKFYITSQQIGLACGLLRHVCRRDAEHPVGQITSLYFDTIDLNEHRKSTSGDFRKDKVRIRWYGESDCRDEVRTIFLELKSKRGFAGTKHRQKMEVPADLLTMPYLAQGIIPKTQLHAMLATFGYFPLDMLWPVVVITYWRHRFIEPLTGVRVSLDYRIRSTMLRPSPGNGERELELMGGVIEIKGTSIELPPTLRQMGMLNVDWSRFSKYSACIDAHDEGIGTVGRLSPSGRIV